MLTIHNIEDKLLGTTSGIRGFFVHGIETHKEYYAITLYNNVQQKRVLLHRVKDTLHKKYSIEYSSVRKYLDITDMSTPKELMDNINRLCMLPLGFKSKPQSPI